MSFMQPKSDTGSIDPYIIKIPGDNEEVKAERSDRVR